VKVEIEDIKRIVLKPNEVLVIKIPTKDGCTFSSRSNKGMVNSFLNGIKETNHVLKGRILVFSNDIELEAVTKT
jgi:hypothetical protein